jgi:hypothetical protein
MYRIYFHKNDVNSIRHLLFYVARSVTIHLRKLFSPVRPLPPPPATWLYQLPASLSCVRECPSPLSPCSAALSHRTTPIWRQKEEPGGGDGTSSWFSWQLAAGQSKSEQEIVRYRERKREPRLALGQSWLRHKYSRIIGES